MRIFPLGVFTCLFATFFHTNAFAETTLSIHGGLTSYKCSTSNVNEYAVNSGMVSIKPGLKDITNGISSGISLKFMHNILGIDTKWDCINSSDSWSYRNEKATVYTGGNIFTLEGVIKAFSISKINFCVGAGGYVFFPYKQLDSGWLEHFDVSRSLGICGELKADYMFDDDYSAEVSTGYRYSLNDSKAMENGIHGNLGLAIHF
jgi:hypothetical protein